jgi:Leucine-rich repeat (LRR) protein
MFVLTFEDQLTKLKRLNLENNLLTKVNLNGLQSLEFLTLAQNRLETLEGVSDLKKIVYLDLNGNRIGSKIL